MYRCHRGCLYVIFIDSNETYGQVHEMALSHRLQESSNQFGESFVAIGCMKVLATIGLTGTDFNSDNSEDAY